MEPPDIGDELEQLRRENARLRRLLQLTEAEASPARGTQAAWFDKAPDPSTHSRPQYEGRVLCRALRCAPRRLRRPLGEHAPGNVGVDAGGRGAGGRRAALRLPVATSPTPDVLAAHLTGDVHVGLYPMLPGDRTCWLAADFDGQAAMLDALAYLKAARAVGAPPRWRCPARGRCPRGSSSPTRSATLARQLGTALVREAIALRGRDGPAVLRPSLPVPGRASGQWAGKPDRGAPAWQVAAGRDHGVPRRGDPSSPSRTSGTTCRPLSA